MSQLVQIIRKRNDHLAHEGDEIELDIEALDTETLWELDRFVTNRKKLVSKTKRQALLVDSASAAGASVSADIDDVPVMEKVDGMKKNKKETGEEDVDIGDEMPESSFPHVEIEKDDDGGQGQNTGHGNENGSFVTSTTQKSKAVILNPNESFTTFGYVAQSLGRLNPWILYKPENETTPNLACTRGMSSKRREREREREEDGVEWEIIFIFFF